MGRSATCLVTAVLFLAAAPVAAQGPAWPERAVRIVVPSPPGSGIDVLARSLAQRLGANGARPVVVENRAGANSIIGAEAVARAAPDGYTLLFASDAVFTINPHVYAPLPYDALADFAPIAQIATFSQFLVAHPSVGARDMPGLLAEARARPGAITYATPGNGSVAHMMSELLKASAGVDLLHVPYKGFAPAVAAVLSGEAGLTWAGAFSVKAQVENGRLHALLSTSARRSPFLPAVPAAREAGFPELAVEPWFGLFAPAATPAGTLEAVQREVARVMADPSFREKELAARAYEAGTLDPREFAATIRREHAARAALVKGIR